MFKVKNKNTRTTSFTPFSSVSIVEIEYANVSWVMFLVKVKNICDKIT